MYTLNPKSRNPKAKMSPRRYWRYLWLKFRRLQGSPKKLAWGMALGVFIGFTPTIPFHTVLALTLAPLLRVSPVTAYLGIWVSNPLTIVPQYLLSYEIGRLVFLRGESLKLPETFDLHSMLHLLWQGGLALQLGGLILALPAALIAYFLTLWAIKRYRHSRTGRPAKLVISSSSHRPQASGPQA